MTTKNTLFFGFGDLAYRVAAKLPGPCVGISRSVRAVPPNTTLWCGEVDSPQMTAPLRPGQFQRVLISLTPRERSDAGYKAAYVDVLQAVLTALQRLAPEQVLLVSSTAVYSGQDAEWVDEASVCRPARFNGQRLLQAENLLVESGLNGAILRLAGIYGPGRDFLQRQVRAGKGGGEAFTNRIHVEDAARFCAYLLERPAAPGMAVFNVCDSAPARGREVRNWLAQQLGVQLNEATDSRDAESKRVSNRKMLATGFRLHYPDYRAGYASLLNSPSSSSSKSSG